MKIYSHSKLSTFEQCNLKYKYKYVDKIKIEEQTIESLLGFAVHNVLEYIYNEAKQGRIPNIDEVITIYSDVWKENHNETIVIMDMRYTSEDYFNKGVKFLVDYYVEHVPFKDNTLETEKKIEMILDQTQEIKLIGYIDRLVHNIEKNQYEIHDYKTANNLPTKEKIDNDKQLAIYSIAIKELFGYDKDVALIWHYLAYNKKIYAKKTNDQLEQLKKEILELINKIENAKDFPASPSGLCSWCEYRKICPNSGIGKTRKVNKELLV